MVKFKKEDEQVGFDITPMIDVVFLLVFFFIMTSSFMKEEPGIKVQLPKSNTADSTVVEKTVIVIEADGRLSVNGTVISLADLRTRLNKNKEIKLKADRRVSYGRVIEVMDELRMIGVKIVNLPVRKKILR